MSTTEAWDQGPFLCTRDIDFSAPVYVCYEETHHGGQARDMKSLPSFHDTTHPPLMTPKSLLATPLPGACAISDASWDAPHGHQSARKLSRMALARELWLCGSNHVMEKQE